MFFSFTLTFYIPLSFVNSLVGTFVVGLATTVLVNKFTK